MIDCHTHNRLRGAEQAGHQGRARLAARGRRDRQGAEIYGLDLTAVRDSRRDPGQVARDRVRAGRRSGEAWEERVGKLSGTKRAEFAGRWRATCRRSWAGALSTFKKEQSEAAPKVATRKSSEMVPGGRQRNGPGDARRVGGPDGVEQHADQGARGVRRREPGAGGISTTGIREHGMAAAMNGIAAHGGVVPYGGTFLCFSDYARGAIRLSCLMGVRVVYVLTHDSIGLGEDGPTQPAGRASGDPARHAEHARVPPGPTPSRPPRRGSWR